MHAISLRKITFKLMLYIGAFFQIDGRMEGLEHIAESFFGPSGYFPQKNIAKMLREKRGISSNKVQDMDEKVNFSRNKKFLIILTTFGDIPMKSFIEFLSANGKKISLIEITLKW